MGTEVKTTRIRMRKTFNLSKMCQKTRILKPCRQIMLTNFSFYSSESKFGTSNLNFPSYTTRKNYKDFEQTPNVEAVANIMVYGLSISPNLYLFPEKNGANSLMEGSLYAIEAVTKNIANSIGGKEKKTSDLTTQLTENCQRNLEAILDKQNISESILVNNEDIFLSWLGKYDESKMKMKICTFSFPSYYHLKKSLQEQDKLEKQMEKDQIETIKRGDLTQYGVSEHLKSLEKFDNFDLECDQHMNKNDIIVSNWDFVKENDDWKIEGISMKKLSDCTIKPFHMRWNYRLKCSIASPDKDYVECVLRYDYGTNLILLVMFLNISYLIYLGFPRSKQRAQ